MVKPQIGLSMLYRLSEPFEKMLECIPNAETIYIELVDDGNHELDRQRASMLKDLGVSYGLKYSIHSPASDMNIASPSKPMLKAMLRRMEKSIACASVLEAYVWVFHPGMKTGISMFYPGRDWLQNLKTVRSLVKIAGNYNVKIAIENVPEPYPFLVTSVEDFARFFAEANEDVGLVLDVGHANINGQIERFLATFGTRIVHMHLSDNNGKDDQHLGIGRGAINWERTAELMKKTSYERTAVVESVEHIEESMQKLKRLFV